MSLHPVPVQDQPVTPSPITRSAPEFAGELSLPSLELSVLPVSPAPDSDLDTDAPASLPNRARILTRTIGAVLRAHAQVQDPSPRHRVQLENFYARACELCPDDQLPSPGGVSGGGGGGGPSAATTVPTKGAFGTWNTAARPALSPRTTPPFTSRSARNARAGPLDLQQVQDLERTWWSSEVVAAWYGPRAMFLSAIASNPDAVPPSMSTSDWTDAVSAAMAIATTTNAASLPGSPALLPTRVTPRRRPMQDRKDPHWVGLHDE